MIEVKQMKKQGDFDSDALKILAAYDYIWDPMSYAFRRARRVEKESTEEYLAKKPCVVSL
jgi:hypothetical protein